MSVKTYPRPTSSYEEIVCTAGVTEGGKWVRIYPVPFRQLPYSQQFRKYSWIQLDLVKSTNDSRPESYKPKRMFDEPIKITGNLDTNSAWRERKRYLLTDVHTSMGTLIKLAYGAEGTSLATLKPREIIDLGVEADNDDWRPELKKHLNQMKLFESSAKREIVRKLPFRYYYHFLTNGDSKPRKLEVTDWEIGRLFWRCLEISGGDPKAANELVKRKFLIELAARDIHFFLGTTYSHHKKKAPNPFSIVGIFYPPHNLQIEMPL